MVVSATISNVKSKNPSIVTSGATDQTSANKLPLQNGALRGALSEMLATRKIVSLFADSRNISRYRKEDWNCKEDDPRYPFFVNLKHNLKRVVGTAVSQNEPIQALVPFGVAGKRAAGEEEERFFDFLISIHSAIHAGDITSKNPCLSSEAMDEKYKNTNKALEWALNSRRIKTALMHGIETTSYPEFDRALSKVPYPPGMRYTFVVATMHARYNGIPEELITSYSDSFTALAARKNEELGMDIFRVVDMSEIWESTGMTVELFRSVGKLLSSASKEYKERLAKNVKTGAIPEVLRSCITRHAKLDPYNTIEYALNIERINTIVEKHHEQLVKQASHYVRGSSQVVQRAWGYVALKRWENWSYERAGEFYLSDLTKGENDENMQISINPKNMLMFTLSPPEFLGAPSALYKLYPHEVIPTIPIWGERGYTHPKPFHNADRPSRRRSSKQGQPPWPPLVDIPLHTQRLVSFPA